MTTTTTRSTTALLLALVAQFASAGPASVLIDRAEAATTPTALGEARMLLEHEIAQRERTCEEQGDGCVPAERCSMLLALAGVLERGGGSREAVLESLEKAAALSRALGPSSPLHVRSVEWLADAKFDDGEYADAMGLWGARLEAWRAEAGHAAQPGFGAMLLRLGEASLLADAPADAIAALDEENALREATGGGKADANSTEAAALYTLLARAHLASGGGEALQRARGYAAAAIDEQARSLLSDGGRVTEAHSATMATYAHVLEALGEDEEADGAMRSAYQLALHAATPAPFVEAAAATMAAFGLRIYRKGHPHATAADYDAYHEHKRQVAEAAEAAGLAESQAAESAKQEL